MPDANVVDGKNKVPLQRFPDGHRPVTDDSAEAVGFPAVESGTDDSDIGGFHFEIAVQISDQIIAIVKTTVPRQGKAPPGQKWLLLAARLSRGVERAIEKSD